MEYEKLVAAIKLCGSEPSVRRCEKECAYYKGGDTKKCIPRMTADAAAAITDLLARAEAAEARAEKAERERDAAVKDLKSAVIGTIHACDYCIKNDPEDFLCDYTGLTGCHEWEWRGQKEE